jgi:hypothetical protein
VLPAVVVIVYLSPIKLTAGVPAVNCASYTIAGSVYTYASTSADPSVAVEAGKNVEYVGVPSVAVKKHPAKTPAGVPVAVPWITYPEDRFTTSPLKIAAEVPLAIRNF